MNTGAAVLNETGTHKTIFEVERWGPDEVDYALRKLGLEPGHDLHPADFAQAKVPSYSKTAHEGNLIMNTMWTALITSYFGTYTAPTKFSTTVGRIGIGDATSPAAAYTDTDLAAAAGSTHRLFKFAAANPTTTITNATRSFVLVATFQAADAMFAWNEFGIDQGTADGTTVVAQLINHAVGISQGTKGTNQVWTATATLSWT